MARINGTNMLSVVRTITVANYNDLTNKPVINADLDATTASSATANRLYCHSGASATNYKIGMLYYTDGTNWVEYQSDKAKADASNLSNANKTSWRNALKCETYTVIYDKNDQPTPLGGNQSYDTGIMGGVAAVMTLTGYRFFRVYCNFNNQRYVMYAQIKTGDNGYDGYYIRSGPSNNNVLFTTIINISTSTNSFTTNFGSWTSSTLSNVTEYNSISTIKVERIEGVS